jgi:hypothetical protein
VGLGLRHGVAVGLSFVWLTAASVQAQESEARSLFDEGRAALDARRWSEARQLLERSLELHSRASTAFNLALALHALDEVVRATELCDGVLGGVYGPIDGDRRARADEVCRDIRADLCVVVIEVTGADRIAIHVDGERVREVPDRGSVEVTLDPGRHVIGARSPGASVGDERVVRLERGERATIALGVSGGRDAEAESSSFAWWAVAVGAAAVALAGAIVAIVLLQPEDPQPVGGDFPVTMTLVMP